VQEKLEVAKKQYRNDKKKLTDLEAIAPGSAE